ncbi:hypothetical protein D3C76_559880 [compost metagenome]
MAALPTTVQVNARALSRAASVDDIARLKAELKLPELAYVDVSAQLELKQAMRRWPLLAEFEQAKTQAEQVVA